VLVLTGHSEQGIREARRGAELDPLSLTPPWLGLSLFYAHRYDEAAEQLRVAVERDPTYFASHLYLGLACEQQGNLSSALAELQTANKLALGGEQFQAMSELGHLYARMGRNGEAEQILKELTRRSEQGYVPAYDFAIVYVGLGRKEQALASLEKAYADHGGGLVWLKVDPELDPLRSDPRFAELLRKVGLAQ
jgi:tetratricopeptide (TPR) repeat protein